MSRCGAGGLTGAFSPLFHAFYFDPPGTPRQLEVGSIIRSYPNLTTRSESRIHRRQRPVPEITRHSHSDPRRQNANRIDDPIPPESLGSTPASICSGALALRQTKPSRHSGRDSLAKVTSTKRADRSLGRTKTIASINAPPQSRVISRRSAKIPNEDRLADSPSAPVILN